MKKLLSAGLVFLLMLGGANAWADADTYSFDPVHTQIFFCTVHLGFSKPCGRLHVSAGNFSFDSKDWSTARVDAVIDINSLDLGDAEWESRVKSGEFLDAQRYPTARFMSQRVEKTSDKTGAQTGVAHGQLILHGKTLKMDLPFTFNKAGVHPYTFKRIAGFSATLKFKRSDFGIDRYLQVVSDEVELRIEAEGFRDRHAGESTPPEAAPDSENPEQNPTTVKEHHDADTQH
ncbi:YceI family protein [Pseudolysobacter antarcticus]|nr:YceI family protein [Pseudolysobacter antarcticus]